MAALKAGIEPTEAPPQTLFFLSSTPQIFQNFVPRSWQPYINIRKWVVLNLLSGGTPPPQTLREMPVSCSNLFIQLRPSNYVVIFSALLISVSLKDISSLQTYCVLSSHAYSPRDPGNCSLVKLPDNSVTKSNPLAPNYCSQGFLGTENDCYSDFSLQCRLVLKKEWLSVLM